jgi:hypothetical protein
VRLYLGLLDWSQGGWKDSSRLQESRSILGKLQTIKCGEGNFDQDDTTTRALNHDSAWSANLLVTSTYVLNLISKISLKLQ